MRSIGVTLGTVMVFHIAAGTPTLAAQAGKAPSAAGTHACSLITDADITRITGRANRFNTPPERAEMPNGSTTCSFVGLDITLTPRVTAQNFETNRKAAAQQPNTATEPLSEVSDEAYYLIRTRSSSSNVGIVFRTGTNQIALGDRVRSDSVAWFKPKLVELAKLAATKLR